MTDRLGAPGSYFFTCLLSKLKNYETFECPLLGNTLISKTFHKMKYENRRLEWNAELSCCTLEYKGISLVCSFAQANELYKFNESDVIPFRDNKVLVTLEKYRLIKRDGENYILNPKFKSKTDVLDIKSKTSSTKKVK